MKWKQLQEQLESKAVYIQFTKMIGVFDGDPDPGMKGKLVAIEDNAYGEKSLHLIFDLSGFETYNRSVATHDWLDDNGKPTLTWFDTEWYPSNGICDIYIPNTLDDNIELFEIIPNRLESVSDCPYCHGDKALYWKDDKNNVFIDNKGEMLITIEGQSIHFAVDRCPKCGFAFQSGTLQ